MASVYGGSLHAPNSSVPAAHHASALVSSLTSRAPCGRAYDHGPFHSRGLRYLAVPDRRDLERRLADRGQGVAIGVAADPGVQERRVVLLARHLGVGVTDVLEEQQSSARQQYSRDLGERGVRVVDTA